VVIEPLGVVRRAAPRRRRLLWRLVAPLLALALLVPLAGTIDAGDDAIPESRLAAGIVLLLVGVVVLLPWLVEALVRRLGGGGSVAWQLAVRRLQVESGAGARVVGGLVVAVAGAIALQSLFTGVDRATSAGVQNAPARAGASVGLPPGMPAERIVAGLREARATRVLATVHEGGLVRPGHTGGENVALVVGDCDDLREFARIGACADGDAFVAAGGNRLVRELARPGARVLVDGERRVGWRLPARLHAADARTDPTGADRPAVLATPAAAGERVLNLTWMSSYLAFDPAVPDGIEYARNAVAAADLTIPVSTYGQDTTPSELRTIRSWLLAGAVVVLMLIAAGLLIGMIEQLRERRRLLAALLAVGVRRRTLGGALLVQTAVPVALGLALAIGAGALLGSLLLRIAGEPVALDGWMIAALTGAAAGVVLLVTALSVPVLLRAMRPDGLRTE